MNKCLPTSLALLKSNTPIPTCPTCQHPLKRRKCKSDWFWGCSAYPECTVTLPDFQGHPEEPRQKPQTTGQRCPECETGEMLHRMIRKGNNKGKSFLGCSRYPDCTHTEWG